VAGVLAYRLVWLVAIQWLAWRPFSAVVMVMALKASAVGINEALSIKAAISM
jgi:hypothetical protein